MTPAVAFIIAGAGYTLRWAQDRAEQRRRFERSIKRFDGLTKTAQGWKTDPPKWADDYVIDLREPPEVQP